MKLLFLALATFTTTACATEEPIGYPDGLGTPESPIPDEEAYAVDTHVRFALHAPAFDRVLTDLRAFAQAPASALIAHADASGDPAWNQLEAALSSTLRSRLDGWIDAEIDRARIAGKPVRQYAGDLAGFAQTVVSGFVIESSLAISPTGANHGFVALNFTPGNLDIVIPIGGLKADAISQHTTATVGEGGALALGEQRFGLAFGHHAWQALTLASETLYGDDTTALAAGIDCAAVANAVAGRCSSGACVGHAPQLEAMCRNGMAALAGELRTQVLAFQLDSLRFARGTARLVDDGADGTADRIVDGTWQVEATGALLASATATFSAVE